MNLSKYEIQDRKTASASTTNILFELHTVQRVYTVYITYRVYIVNNCSLPKYGDKNICTKFFTQIAKRNQALFR